MRILVIALLTSILSGCSPAPKTTATTSFTLSWSGNERAIPVLQEKLRGDSDNPDLNAALGQAYLQKARETGDPSYYTKSEQLFDRALAKSDDHLEALIGQASLAMSRHEFEKARDIAWRAASLNGYSAAVRGILADALVQLRDYDKAVRVLDEMVRLKPNLSSYSRISYMRELKGDTEGAIQAMQMAIQAGAPDAENTAWCIVQLGNLYLGSSRLSDAEAGFRAALARFPGYVHAYAGLAKVAAAKNNFASAAEYYRKAADRVPMPEFLIGLASVYRKMGKPYEAQAQLDLVSNIKKVYEANGVSMDAEIAQLMEKAGIQQTGS
ncbi:MAG: tetratricopeptide repeat protein [Acidobacteria bacterium]|nr:tetratricopeptide repeat protein [Acidobacteriota bacterium]